MDNPETLSALRTQTQDEDNHDKIRYICMLPLFDTYWVF